MAIAHSIAAAAFLAATPALAGDFAEFRPIGFSPDGTVFAFEQFGVQDGSGFPYAERFYIDTANDRYLPGTPVRVRLDRDGASLAEARAQAASQAAAVEEESGAGAAPGIFAAFRPATEEGNDPFALHYRAFAADPSIGGTHTVRLTEKTLPAGGACAGQDGPFKGFRLEMTERDGQPASLVLADDPSIPASRGCPLSYAIGGALTHPNPDGSATHVLLVLVRSLGFEGPDGRWLAVTRRID